MKETDLIKEKVSRMSREQLEAELARIDNLIAKAARPQDRRRAEKRRDIIQAALSDLSDSSALSVEVLPPEPPAPDPKAVKTCVREISKFQRSIAKKSRDLVYEIVSAGLFLLKLRELHLAQGQHPALGGGDGDGEPHGFYRVIEDEFANPDIEDDGERRKHLAALLRTTRNYMTAARNAGLTAEHEIADVQRLKKQHALDDRTASELYRLKDKTPHPAASDDDEKPNLAAQAAGDLSAACDAIRSLRDQTDPDVYQANVTTLRETLDLYTDARWDMVESAVDHAEHAEVHRSHPSHRPHSPR